MSETISNQWLVEKAGYLLHQFELGNKRDVFDALMAMEQSVALGVLAEMMNTTPGLQKRLRSFMKEMA